MGHRDSYAVVKAQHRKALAETVDFYLLPHGFTRTPSGTTYARRDGDNSQSIDVFFRVPRDRNSDIYSEVTSRCTVYLKNVNSTALSIAGNETLLPFGKDTTIWQQAGQLSDEPGYKTWEVYFREEYVAVADEVRGFLEAYVIPFLDSYWSAADIARHYKSDPRLPNAQGWPLIPAASHYLSGNYPECVRIINERLGMNAGGRSRYRNALIFAADLEDDMNEKQPSMGLM
jgi:hypothetical protein